MSIFPRFPINRETPDANNTKLLVANGALKTIAKEAVFLTSQSKGKTGAFMEGRRLARMVGD